MVGHALLKGFGRSDHPTRPQRSVRSGIRPAIGPLTDTLLHEDWRVGRVVVRALGIMGEPAVGPPLSVIREGNDTARKGAVAVEALDAIFYDEDWCVRKAAEDAVERIRERDRRD